jgi:hypothetical protein
MNITKKLQMKISRGYYSPSVDVKTSHSTKSKVKGFFSKRMRRAKSRKTNSLETSECLWSAGGGDMEPNKTIGTTFISPVETPESTMTQEPISTPSMSPVESQTPPFIVHDYCDDEWMDFESPPLPSTVHDNCDDEWIDFVTFRREALFQNDRYSNSSFDVDENTATNIFEMKTVRQKHLGEDPSSTAPTSIQEEEKENPSVKAMLDASDLSSPVSSSDEEPSSSFLNNSVLSAISEIEKVDDSIDIFFQTEQQSNGYQKKAASSPSSIMDFFQKQIFKIQDELCTTSTICVPKFNFDLPIFEKIDHVAYFPKWQS